MHVGRFLTALAFLAPVPAARADAVVRPEPGHAILATVADGAGGRPDGALPEPEGNARLVGLILAFTRWPGARPHPDPVRLCVAGPAGRAGGLAGLRLPGGQGVRRIDLTHPAAASAANCDAVYLGGVNSAVTQQMVHRLRGQPVLTMAEAGTACAAAAMFCLMPGGWGHPFRFDIAAVGDSTVTIDPRLLRMGQGG